MQVENSPVTTDNSTLGAKLAGFSERKFIVFMAATTSIVAFSVDMMLPALLEIGGEYQVTDINDVQLVIIAFIFSFGLSQLLFGPLVDTFGRRKILIISLFSFAFFSVSALFAPSFELLLAARMAAGVSAGAARSSSQAIVRDCFVGSDMARIMSHVLAVFMIAPIIAPPIGQLIINISNWHWIFLFLGIGGALTAIWASMDLHETHPVEKRRDLSISGLRQAFVESLAYRRSTGYMIVSLAMISCLFSFIITTPQIFGQLYNLGDNFIYVFIVSAACLAASSIINGRILKSVSIRYIVHISILAFLLLTSVFIFLAYTDNVTLPFMIFTTMTTMLLFGFINTNSTAIALEPMGHIAGTASSLINTIGVSGGAFLGGLVGRLYDGSVVPMATGYFIFACVALIAAFWGERGSLTLRKTGPQDN